MNPPSIKIPHIDEIFAADENNRIQVARAMEKWVLALPDDVATLYNAQSEAVRFSFPDRAAHVAGLLYVSCSQRLAMGIMALLRRNSSQAFRETRVAIEAAGIAYEIRRDQESLEIFLADRGDPQCRLTARNRFGAKTIFQGNASVLKAAYDKASELSHNNRRTLSIHINSQDSAYSYQDLADNDIPLLSTNYLLWICVAHMNTLELTDTVFSNIENDAVLKFRKERKFIAERLARFHQKNEQDLVDSPSTK